MKRRNILLLLTVIYSLGNSVNSYGQDVIDFEIIKTYSFVKLNENYIHNDSALNNTFEKLFQLKLNNDRIVNILHIGDSHLQADFITYTIRTAFQNNFGNAGRGLIVPLKVARTNEPFNYLSSSSFYWQSKRCVFLDQPLPIGIGGVTISNDSFNSSFNMKTFDYLPLSYSFNKLSLFYLKDSSSYNFNVKDSIGNEIGYINSLSQSDYANVNTINLKNLTNQISIQAIKTNNSQKRAVIFGISLMNSNKGVLYNTVGVNGAQFKHYSKSQYFCEQTNVLAPDLIIISLGTNEANDSRFNEDVFYREIETLVINLKKQNPNSEFLLTTPANSYYQKNKFNPRMSLVAASIICFAKDNNIAYWDLQSATSGKNSAYSWKKNNLLRPDGVHYTQDGYKLQGNLFCKAFFNAYNNYVSNRPK